MVAECSSGISKYRLDYTVSLSTMLVTFIPITLITPKPTRFRITRSYLELTYVGFWTDGKLVPVNQSFMKDYHKLVISQTIEPSQFVFCWTITQWWRDNRPFLKKPTTAFFPFPARIMTLYIACMYSERHYNIYTGDSSVSTQIPSKTLKRQSSHALWLTQWSVSLGSWNGGFGSHSGHSCVHIFCVYIIPYR
jgi:hypothetical protein